MATVDVKGLLYWKRAYQCSAI